MPSTTAVEFIKIGAPDYMWLGIVSLLLLTILIITATVPDRIRLHENYSTFKYWHRVLTVAIILSAAYHIVVSNFYLHAWYQGAVFSLVSIGVCFGRTYWVRLGQIEIAPPVIYLSLCTVCVVAFAAIRNIPA